MQLGWLKCVESDVLDFRLLQVGADVCNVLYSKTSSYRIYIYVIIYELDVLRFKNYGI